MIKQIKLRNFQIWRKLILELDPYVTTIVGDNDKGKTSIYRALYWLAMARPLGDEFVKYEAEKCIVTAILEDDVLVGRMRNKAGAAYRIGDTIYKASGTNVPEEVSKLLNLSDINFQNQLDPPLWFLETAGTVAKNLNSVINLDVIDDTLGRAAATVRTHHAQQTASVKAIEAIQGRLDGLKWVPEFETELVALEQLESEYLQARGSYLQLRSLVGEGARLTDHKDNLNLALSELVKLVDVAEGLFQTESQLHTLESYVSQAREYQDILDRPVPDLDEFDEQAGEISEALRAMSDAHVNFNKLSLRLNQITELQAEIDGYENERVQLEQRLHDETEGRCPLCGQNLPTSSPSAAQTSTSPRTHRSQDRKR